MAETERERTMKRIYVASSWRNEFQPAVVEALRAEGHEVYDFRDHGFRWRTVSGDWLTWSPSEYIAGLAHPEAERGFARDMDALRWCDVCIMVMPCGPSASLEAGWAAGAGKPVAVYMPGIREPDLMVKVADLLTTDLAEVIAWADAVLADRVAREPRGCPMGTIEAYGSVLVEASLVTVQQFHFAGFTGRSQCERAALEWARARLDDEIARLSGMGTTVKSRDPFSLPRPTRT